jgi:serine/threonine protein kinase
MHEVAFFSTKEDATSGNVCCRYPVGVLFLVYWCGVLFCVHRRPLPLAPDPTSSRLLTCVAHALCMDCMRTGFAQYAKEGCPLCRAIPIAYGPNRIATRLVGELRKARQTDGGAGAGLSALQLELAAWQEKHAKLERLVNVAVQARNKLRTETQQLQRQLQQAVQGREEVEQRRHQEHGEGQRRASAAAQENTELRAELERLRAHTQQESVRYRSGQQKQQADQRALREQLAESVAQRDTMMQRLRSAHQRQLDTRQREWEERSRATGTELQRARDELTVQSTRASTAEDRQRHWQWRAEELAEELRQLENRELQDSPARPSAAGASSAGSPQAGAADGGGAGYLSWLADKSRPWLGNVVDSVAGAATGAAVGGLRPVDRNAPLLRQLADYRRVERRGDSRDCAVWSATRRDQPGTMVAIKWLRFEQSASAAHRSASMLSRAGTPDTSRVALSSSSALAADAPARPVTRAYREAMFLHTLRHDNVLSLLGVCALPAPQVGMALVMPFAEYDLAYCASELDGKALSLQQMASFMQQLLSAVRYLHRHRVVHRAITPTACLLDRCHRLRLGSFGAARSLLDLPLEQAPSSTTYHCIYLPPELLCCRPPADAGAHSHPFEPRPPPAVELTANDWLRADMWAVGCLFAQLLLRSAAFTGQSAASVLRHQLRHADVRSAVDPVTLRALQPGQPTVSLSARLRTVQSGDGAESAIELCCVLLCRAAEQRPGARDALQHRFIAGELGSGVMAAVGTTVSSAAFRDSQLHAFASRQCGLPL